MVGLIAGYFRGSFAWFGVVLVVVEALPLWWRRRFPVVVLAIVVCAEVAKWALQVSNDPSGPALVFAVYAVSAYGRTRERLLVAVAAITIIVFAVALLILGQFPVSRTLIPLARGVGDWRLHALPPSVLSRAGGTSQAGTRPGGG